MDTAITTVSVSAVTLTLAVVIVILAILLCMLALSHRRLKDRMDKLMGSQTEGHDLENMLLEYLDEVRSIQEGSERTLAAIDDIYAKLARCVQRVGIIRYNPFNDTGGDLSFALALLDERGDGVVINVIRGRDITYTYGKPVKRDTDDQTLSDEELEAIQMAWSSELGRRKKLEQ
jgi:hypothetical protein